MQCPDYFQIYCFTITVSKIIGGSFEIQEGGYTNKSRLHFRWKLRNRNNTCQKTVPVLLVWCFHKCETVCAVLSYMPEDGGKSLVHAAPIESTFLNQYCRGVKSPIGTWSSFYFNDGWPMHTLGWGSTVKIFDHGRCYWCTHFHLLSNGISGCHMSENVSYSRTTRFFYWHAFECTDFQFSLSPIIEAVIANFHGSFKHMLAKVTAMFPEDWDRYLLSILFVYREVPHKATGFVFYQTIILQSTHI